MDKSFNDELFSLLESKRDFADVDECIKLMGEEGTRYHGSALVPLREAINIYQTRSRINSELKNGIVKGYETLLPALEKAEVQNVRIHLLELLSRSYWIFTDEAVSYLFGFLTHPKKEAAWFPPVPGYD